MIFPEIRNRYIVSEVGDPELAVVLLDVVLGYGAHPDMAGELSNSIQAAKSKVEDRGDIWALSALSVERWRTRKDTIRR